MPCPLPPRGRRTAPRSRRWGAACGSGSSRSAWSFSSSTSSTSTVSAWSAVYLRQTLAASLAVAPLAYAAYQAGTVIGRVATDRLVQRFGGVAVVRTAALLVAGALAGMATAPSWPFAVLAAGVVGLGASVLAPLCLASAAWLRPAASAAVLARLNLFNYAGVITGGAVSGLLGSTGRFRLAYAAPAALAVLVLAAARHFTQQQPPRPARAENVPPFDRADPQPLG